MEEDMRIRLGHPADCDYFQFTRPFRRRRHKGSRCYARYFLESRRRQIRDARERRSTFLGEGVVQKCAIDQPARFPELLDRDYIALRKRRGGMNDKFSRPKPEHRYHPPKIHSKNPKRKLQTPNVFP